MFSRNEIAGSKDTTIKLPWVGEHFDLRVGLFTRGWVPILWCTPVFCKSVCFKSSPNLLESDKKR